ncbi:MAG: esterase-like activity of phytase family protein [Solirubrobacteraceae bacterium]
MSRSAVAVLVAVAALGASTLPAGAAPQPSEDFLRKRAILPAEATAPAPWNGAPNAEPAPAPGSSQPVGGFSALLDAPGRDVYWAMPDNGFGSKQNSRSFILRVYRIRADWETARGGEGDVEILDWIQLSDPEERIPFKIVREGSEDRILTGGDFDPESMRIAPDGTLWFGEEFGPFLVHTDATGKVLEAPIPARGVRSPQYPGFTPEDEPRANLSPSNGFEGMALSTDGKKLYPALEGPLRTDSDKTRRWIYEFDLRTERYTGKRFQYRVADASYLISDFTALGDGRYVVLERDNFENAAAVHKRAFVIDLGRVGPDGFLIKREVLDLLSIRDRTGISAPPRPGDFGIGDPFKMPYVTIEAVLPEGDQRLVIVNDTNFGSRGRNRDLPDYSDLINVRVPELG